MANWEASGCKFSALIVEDDLTCAEMLAGLLRREGGEPVICRTLRSATAAVAQRPFDLLLLDYLLPDGEGSAFYQQLRGRGRGVPTIMLTAHPSLSVAVELTREGLFDYVVKPFDVADVLGRVRKVLGATLRPEPVEEQAGLLGCSPAIHKVQRMLAQAADQSNTTVLLTGETGTGKDLAARYLHALTYGRREPPAPFICVDCPTVPAEMFEGELFGAEKGAYTGAYQQRTGLVEAAQEGTLFLNEIAEVPLTLQAKLLQLIEAREYRRLGSTEVQRYVGRIIAASNRNLPEEVRAGRFRDDLWYRLDVFSIRLPALREHVEDLELLAQALLERLAQSYGRPKPQIRPGDLQALRRHDFPGNVRELRNLLERSLLQTPAGSGWLEIDAAWVGSLKTPAPVQGPSAERDLSPLEARELAAIRQALRDAKGVVRRGAARLGISHSTLLRRIDRWPELRALLAPGQDEDLKGG